MRPHDLPPPSHWANRPHGTRVKYRSGCRCLRCRACNSRYECFRRRERLLGRGNGFVPAAPIRAHVDGLARAGMGFKTVARAARVGRTMLLEIKMDRQVQLRAAAARLILAVRYAPALGTHVPAAPTNRRIAQLVADGWPKARIAKLLGLQVPALQFRPTLVTRRTELRIEKLHRFLRAEARRAA